MTERLLVPATLAILWTAASAAQAQPAFTSVTDVVGYDFEQFRGLGYEPDALAGDGTLDSNAWRVLGLSDGDSTFGGTHDTGDFARAISEGSVATGGVYAFDVNGAPAFTDYALGVQPGGSDFTPGSHQLRILNSTGSEIRALELVYEIHYLNNELRGNTVDLRIIRESDGAEVTVPSVSFTTPDASAAVPIWTQVDRSAVVDIDAIAIPDGEYLIVSWDSDDSTGSGSRDEIALDDVLVGIPACGNGAVDSGETCDDGDVVTETECPYGMASCTLCNADCSAVLTLTGPVCGDSAVDTDEGEACDDGNTVSETACDYGTTSCTACSADCSSELSLMGAYCGDGTTDSGDGEACDDGDTDTETECDYGMATCTLCSADCGSELSLTGAVCGDGTTDTDDGEACDDGNTVSETECAYGMMTCAACADDCGSELSLTGAYCGDGTVDTGEGEECDDGNTTAGDGCSDACATEEDLDAGVPDAGMGDAGVDLDAGVVLDAGPEEDAGAEADGGEEADGAIGSDGGLPPREDDGGCSCSAPGASPSGPAFGLLALVGLGLVLRRRRD